MLKYGAIVNVAVLDAWQLACIERLHQSKLADLRLIVSARGNADCAPISALVPDARRCDMASARNAGVDFFLSFGDPRAAAPLLDAAPYGVWHFALSDVSRFSTSTPGFWEVHDAHDVTGAYLLRLTADGGPGIPLKCGFLPTISHSFEQNLKALQDAVTMWPAHVCWDLAQGAAGYFRSAAMPVPPEHRGDPSALNLAKVRLRERQRLARSFVRDKFFTIQWTLARVKQTPGEFIGAERRAEVSHLYPSTKDRYFADPCVIARDSRAYVFCEEYRNPELHGDVAVCEFGENGAGIPQPAIRETHHLSYPHVFEYGGQTYCIPESGGIRKVCLYRCVEFPHKWEYVHTLIEGFEAADSTIVEYGGRWWLFCTSSEAVPKGHYSHLYVWHADHLFGTWTQHVRNPVKIDARSARPGGPFFAHGGALYRPAQDCSRSYGCAIRINRIDTLTESDFAETVVGTIRPPRTRYTRGVHTISSDADWCVVDVKRYAFNPVNARYACTQAVKRALLRLGFSQEAIARFNRSAKPQGAAGVRTAQPSKIE